RGLSRRTALHGRHLRRGPRPHRRSADAREPGEASPFAVAAVAFGSGESPPGVRCQGWRGAAMNVDRPRGSMQLSRREVLAAGAAALALPGCVRAATNGAEPPAPLRLASGPAMPIALAGVPRGAAPESVAQAVRVAACGPDDLAWLSRGDTGRVIVGDMSGVQSVRFWKDGLRGSSRTLMKQNGIARAADEAGAELHAFEEARWDGFFDGSPTVPGPRGGRG